MQLQGNPFNAKTKEAEMWILKFSTFAFFVQQPGCDPATQAFRGFVSVRRISLAACRNCWELSSVT